MVEMEQWSGGIPDDEWEIYRKIIVELQERGIAFVLGGAFSLAAYSHHWRNTKDIDLYIHPDSRDAVVETFNEAGLKDYFDVLEYDRWWIYRAYSGETIADAIWAMPNRRAQVDQRWLTFGPEIMLRDMTLRVLPAEEAIWAKLYVMQRTRCDWPDIFNILYGTAATLDWDHLFDRVGDELPVLAGIVSTFGWLCPGRAHTIPESAWKRLGLPRPADGPDYNPYHVRLFDSRPWFAPMIESDGDGDR